MDQKQRSIAEKYSLDYYRRTLPTRSWKSPWNYIALLLAIVVIAGMYLIGRNTTFQAAPVASVHSSFGTDCGSCHDQSWAPARRLVQLSGGHHSVSDSACQECHRAAPHTSVALDELACAACHQEHRPDKRLVDVSDGACTSCHRDLTSTGVSQVSFVPKIDRFETGAAGHPEFALLRPNADGVGPRHEAHAVARLVKTSDDAAKWQDRGGLKFNHQHHLDPAGVLNPARESIQLSCSDCHTLDPDSGYMRAIEYDEHCSRCHPLNAAAPLAALGELPHSSVEEVRGVVRERLARLMEQSAMPSAPSESSTRLPRLPRPARLAADQERELATQMEAADHAVFGLEAKGMCRHCHYFVERDNQWHVLAQNPAVANQEILASSSANLQMVPARWMRHATFNHKSHRAVECVACHQAIWSSETADILMPSISVCRNCHGEGVQTRSMRVGADCVLCHRYHGETHAIQFEGVPLEQLFSPAGASSHSRVAQ